MGAKVALVAAGFVAGYLVGTKRGRKQYEQVKRQAADFVNSARVQKGLSDAQQFMSDNMPVVGETVASVIRAVRDAARDTSRPEASREGSGSDAPSRDVP